MNAVTHRRWKSFQRNRRGFWSLWVFLSFLLISSCAELIANNRPLFVSFQGKWFFPLVEFVSDIDMGGALPISCRFESSAVQARVRDHGGMMIWPIIPFSPHTLDLSQEEAPAPPSSVHWLGTDDQGRDVAARLVYGFRLSAYFGLFLAFLSVSIAVVMGAIQGYFGGVVDLILQRITEIWSGMPILYILIILSGLLTPTFWWLLILMSLFSWMGLANLVRAEFLRARQLDYVRAAKALGVPSLTIIGRHVLPNAMISVITYLPFLMNTGISALTSLDFLGFGFPPGTPSLGEMLSQGKNSLYAPWLGVTSFLTMSLLLSLLIFIGEGIRDAFDPRQSGENVHRRGNS